MTDNLDGIDMELYSRVREIGKKMIVETLSKPTSYLRTINDFQVFDSLVKTVRDEFLQSQWKEIKERTRVRIYVADSSKTTKRNRTIKYIVFQRK